MPISARSLPKRMLQSTIQSCAQFQEDARHSYELTNCPIFMTFYIKWLCNIGHFSGRDGFWTFTAISFPLLYLWTIPHTQHTWIQEEIVHTKCDYFWYFEKFLNRTQCSQMLEDPEGWSYGNLFQFFQYSLTH